MSRELEQSFQSVERLLAAFRHAGCDEVLVKPLAKQQDNEKNQIYLGQNMTMVSYFPGNVCLRANSTSIAKHRSEPGKAIVSLELDFYWLWPSGEASVAPNASIIEYAQYPEVRLSGFSANCSRSPQALKRDLQGSYGRRYLVLGIAAEKVFGAVVTEVGDPRTVKGFELLPAWPVQPLLKVLDSGKTGIDEGRLVEEVRNVCGRIHKPQILSREGDAPQQISPVSQAGGWTLEALLGIPRNSRSGPDKYGFEVKAVGGSRTSVITTEADFGFRAEQGVAEFLTKYGRPAKDGSKKLVFTGTQKCGQPNEQSGTVLTIENWDFTTNTPTGEGQPNVVLIEQKSEEVIAGWSFAKLASSWTKKHAGALYVETNKVTGASGEIAGYRYGSIGLLGKGTSPLLLLEQVALGNVFLDPGDSKKPDSPAHARTQWRVNGSISGPLTERLAPLYHDLKSLQL